MNYPGIPKNCFKYQHEFVSCYDLKKIDQNYESEIKNLDNKCSSQLHKLHTCISKHYGEKIKNIR